jgi:alpha-glucosidase
VTFFGTNELLKDYNKIKINPERIPMEKTSNVVLHNHKEYQVHFYSPYGFHLYEVGAKSPIELFPEALGESVAAHHHDKSGYHYSLGGSSLTISLDGKVTFYRQKRVVASFQILGESKQEAESFAEGQKEGHHPSGDTHPYEGGVAFQNNSPVYGLGDKTGPLDKRGYSYLNYNTDNPAAQVDTFKSLYKSINFVTLFYKYNSIGFFLNNSARTYFDINKKDPEVVEATYAEGKLDLHVFVGSFLKVCSYFGLLTGTCPLPPRWALGYQQSRWSYGDEAEVESVIANYQKIGCPLAAVHLDIAYMDHYKDFSVDSVRYPDLGNWAKKLLAQGVHLVTIIDAGVKAEEGYPVYDEGVKKGYFSTLEGKIYHNEVWPGDSVFPAFINPKVQAWWGDHVASFLTKNHIAGIWNDMNEPASFKGPLPEEVEMGGLPHSLAHNVYGHYMDKATYEGFIKAKKRPFIITRAAYAGTSHYSTAWTGDNQSIWDHLRLSIPQMANLSASGEQMIGNDIGGFGGDVTKELLLRWIALGVFSPLMRNHSAYMTRNQEGYQFDEETSRIYATMVKTRYRIIPYLYDLLRESSIKGTPVYRSLAMNYPDDSYTYNEVSEVMLGDALLLAPALNPGEHHRYVYFPDDFYDFFSGKAYKKGHYFIETPLDRLPLFVRKGAIVPLAPLGTLSPEEPATVELYVTPGSAAYFHYQDEGEGLGYLNGRYNLLQIKKMGKKVKIAYVHRGLPGLKTAFVLLAPNGKKKTCFF